MEVDFRRETLRRAPEVIQRRTRSLWVDTKHQASKDTVKVHHKRGLYVDIFLVAFSFFIWMHDYSLDMWMNNMIIMTTLTLIRQHDNTALTN